MKICEEIYLPSFFSEKMLMSAFLLKFKANYLRKKMRGYASFSLWTLIAPAKIYFFPRGTNLAQKPLYVVGTVLNNETCSSYINLIMHAA